MKKNWIHEFFKVYNFIFWKSWIILSIISYMIKSYSLVVQGVWLWCTSKCILWSLQIAMKPAMVKLLMKIFSGQQYVLSGTFVYAVSVAVLVLRMFSTLIPLWPIFWSFSPLCSLIIRPSHEYIDHVLPPSNHLFFQEMKVHRS